MELSYAEAVHLHKQNEIEHQSIAPHSCDWCQRLWLDLRAGVPDIQEGRTNKGDEDGKRCFRVQNTGVMLIDLLNGALDGCDFFSALVQSNTYLTVILERMEGTILAAAFDNASSTLQSEFLVDTTNAWKSRWLLPPGTGIYLTDLPHGKKFEAYDRVEWEVKWKRSLELGITLDLRPLSQELHFWGGNLQLGRYIGFDIPGNIVPHPIVGLTLPPNLAPESNLTLRRAKAWLGICRHSHPSCNMYITPYRPKRLLEIVANGESVVLRSDHPSSLYATLSYCWGGDQAAKTTITRLNQYRTAFSIHTLPATIRDAVQEAYRLGFLYVWIDSMCIVQDDNVDLQEQLGQMHNIFRGASITIVASRAAKSTEGFLQHRIARKPFVVPVRFDEDMVSRLILSPRPQNTSSWTNRDPIFSRGWTFQELRLSTRLLTFGRHDTHFICLEAAFKDGGSPLTSKERRRLHGSSPGSVDIQSLNHPRAWAYLVRQYADRELSVPTDKLPALGALAAEYGSKKALKKYYAGLWEEDFLWQLLWRTNQTVKREAAYCGPTWSWCSLPVSQLYFPGSDPSKYRMTSILMDIQVELLSASNPYGEVKAAHLTLRGRTRRIIWIVRSESGDAEYQSSGRLEFGLGRRSTKPRSDVSGRFVKGEISGCDIEEEMHCPAGSETRLLAIEIGSTGLGDGIDWETWDRTRRNDHFSLEPQGLVLRDIGMRDGQIHYKRVGSLTLRSSRLFQAPDVIEREVVII